MVSLRLSASAKRFSVSRIKILNCKTRNPFFTESVSRAIQSTIRNVLLCLNVYVCMSLCVFFENLDISKKLELEKKTHDIWHMTYDTCHVTPDTWFFSFFFFFKKFSVCRIQDFHWGREGSGVYFFSSSFSFSCRPTIIFGIGSSWTFQIWKIYFKRDMATS